MRTGPKGLAQLIESYAGPQKPCLSQQQDDGQERVQTQAHAAVARRANEARHCRHERKQADAAKRKNKPARSAARGVSPRLGGINCPRHEDA